MDERNRLEVTRTSSQLTTTNMKSESWLSTWESGSYISSGWEGEVKAAYCVQVQLKLISPAHSFGSLKLPAPLALGKKGELKPAYDHLMRTLIYYDYEMGSNIF
ncbi:hypothetical protein Nepgr_008361 [Nepenthes gracilis]|uniref:Uncharacterized protein n=1 Tax=Nepenthes gracilis TaxID=150966 RepID=A0AAD3S8X7_NEPGR|nr:hypothetical protein Nepgr_008361 [Nepenthes gracilis]